MFLETVYTEGLCHLSYVIGDKGKAAVIDPRRDCKLYVDIARRYGAQITHIFETHSHEDFISGALELSRRTKAPIFHGTDEKYQYGETVKNKQQFCLGSALLEILETPGHTLESICIAVIDKNFSDKAVAVFTGDTLLVGETGRVDLFPSMSHDLANKLYESIHQKLIPLGNQVIIYPAHSIGSISGYQLAERNFSTIGYERKNNRALQRKRKEFVRHKLAEKHYYGPYFRQVAYFNKAGIQLVPKLPEPNPINPNEFAGLIKNNKIFVLDIRSPEAFAGAHIPNSLNIPLNILSIMGGWYLPYDQKIGIVAENLLDIQNAWLYLMRLGYDNIANYLVDGIRSWVSAGLKFESLATLDLKTLHERYLNQEEFLLLDVRKPQEWIDEPSACSKRIWAGELPKQIGNIPQDKRIITLCEDGQCAALAASYLKQKNTKFKRIEICLGSLNAYKANLKKNKRFEELQKSY